VSIARNKAIDERRKYPALWVARQPTAQGQMQLDQGALSQYDPALWLATRR